MMVLAHGPNGWSYPPVGLYALLGQHNMRAISCEMGVARMPGARRHRIVAGMLVVLLSGLASGTPLAQDAKLLADCAAPQRVDSTGASPGAAPVVTATVSCEVRSTDAVAFKSVRVGVKGRSEPLEADFKGFDTRSNSLVAMFLIQILEPARRSTLTQMADAVVKIAEQRDGNRRLAAYSFDNDLTLLADFNASKRDFDRQVRAVRTAALPSQLYKTSLDAIAKLAKERADRKALIILGDGQSDDTADEHDQVVRAAKEAGVAIHALGFLASAADAPKFQTLRRLADETGGFRREVRIGGAQRYTVNNQFVADALENGGSLKITLKEPPGSVPVTITASLADGRSESIDRTFALLAPSASPQPSQPPQQQPSQGGAGPVGEPVASVPWYGRLLRWAQANLLLAGVIGVALIMGAAGLTVLAVNSFSAGAPEATLPDQGARVYGWLDMLDGNASRYPLRTTNVRIGRHRDNDICLQNDSISRRHALLHFNADNRRFVITDLGGDNGVIVNKVKQQSHELSDGDLVELGEVRLRFRVNTELVGAR
jgi:FHA domain/von Willebrand factor type A domain